MEAGLISRACRSSPSVAPRRLMSLALPVIAAAGLGVLLGGRLGALAEIRLRACGSSSRPSACRCSRSRSSSCPGEPVTRRRPRSGSARTSSCSSRRRSTPGSRACRSSRGDRREPRGSPRERRDDARAARGDAGGRWRAHDVQQHTATSEPHLPGSSTAGRRPSGSPPRTSSRSATSLIAVGAAGSCSRRWAFATRFAGSARRRLAP